MDRFYIWRSGNRAVWVTVREGQQRESRGRSRQNSVHDSIRLNGLLRSRSNYHDTTNPGTGVNCRKAKRPIKDKGKVREDDVTTEIVNDTMSKLRNKRSPL